MYIRLRREKMNDKLVELVNAVVGNVDGSWNSWDDIDHICDTYQIENDFDSNEVFFIEKQIQEDGKNFENDYEEIKAYKFNVYGLYGNDKVVEMKTLSNYCNGEVHQQFTYPEIVELHRDIYRFESELSLIIEALNQDPDRSYDEL